jgi:8-amino-7-oxononanoate synthase
MSTLFEAGDRVGSDALNHASLIDGLRLSRAERVILPHGDPRPTEPLRAAVIEGLYSMDGDAPDVAAYAACGERWLVVDEAHAVGCLGPGGRGVAARAGVAPDVITGTFGKSYGAAGAFVVGPEPLIELLVSAGRSFVYTTALAEPAARAALAGLGAATDARRQRLAENVARFRGGLADLGLSTRGRDHVVPVLTGPDTMGAAARLLEAGVFVPGIRAPTVPPGEERLRFSLSAAHTPAQIDRALEALAQCVSLR